MCADGNLIVICKWFLFKSTILMEIWSKTDANPKENRKWSKKPWKLKQKTQRGGLVYRRLRNSPFWIKLKLKEMQNSRKNSKLTGKNPKTQGENSWKKPIENWYWQKIPENSSPKLKGVANPFVLLVDS